MSQATSVAALRHLVNNFRNTRSFIPKSAVIAILREVGAKWSKYQFKTLGYIISHPGGLQTNAVFVTLEKVRSGDLIHGVVLRYDRKDGIWQFSKELHTLERAILSDDLSYEQGEQIVRLLHDNAELIKDHEVSAITTIANATFFANEPLSGNAPKGTQYIVELITLTVTTTHTTRFVYIATDNAVFKILGKKDLTLIH